jgi:hypothetical protein
MTSSMSGRAGSTTTSSTLFAAPQCPQNRVPSGLSPSHDRHAQPTTKPYNGLRGRAVRVRSARHDLDTIKPLVGTLVPAMTNACSTFAISLVEAPWIWRLTHA